MWRSAYLSIRDSRLWNDKFRDSSFTFRSLQGKTDFPVENVSLLYAGRFARGSPGVSTPPNTIPSRLPTYRESTFHFAPRGINLLPDNDSALPIVSRWNEPEFLSFHWPDRLIGQYCQSIDARIVLYRARFESWLLAATWDSRFVILWTGGKAHSQSGGQGYPWVVARWFSFCKRSQVIRRVEARLRFVLCTLQNASDISLASKDVHWTWYVSPRREMQNRLTFPLLVRISESPIKRLEWNLREESLPR